MTRTRALTNIANAQQRMLAIGKMIEDDALRNGGEPTQPIIDFGNRLLAPLLTIIKASNDRLERP